jgi:hypothetical protein
MKRALTVLTLMLLSQPALAAPQAKIENCGWLVLHDGALVEQPNPALLPSDPGPLPAPPTGARAAYCLRDTMMSYIGDQRVVALGLPLVIRDGKNEGVLEANPTVLFNYHKVGDRYLPGRGKN